MGPASLDEPDPVEYPPPMDKTLGALLLAALLLRGGLDLLWWVTLPGVRSLGAVSSAVILAGCAVVLITSSARIPRIWLLPAALFGALVAGASVRGPGDWIDALRWSLLYLGPLAFGAAVRIADPEPRTWVRVLLAGACLPLGLSLVLLATGQPEALVLHGYPRLVGPFKNHHNMALFASSITLLGLYAAVEERGPWRWASAVLAGGASVCLFFTYVRTCWILTLGTVALWLLFERRWIALASGAAAGALCLVTSPTLQERFSDLAHVLSGVPPADGWGAIGSSRVHIWTDSFANFSAGGWPAFALGNGLGGHMGLHKDLDPHCEYLTLLYQLGIAGPLVYLSLFGLAAWGCYQRRDRLGNLVTALVILTAATCLISNDFLGRTTFAWGLWAAIALTWTQPAERHRDRRREQQGRADPKGLRELGGHIG